MGARFEDIKNPYYQRQALEKYARQQKGLKPQERPRESKYHNQRTEVSGIRFDSKREAERYQELLVRLEAGEIKDLKLQPSFTLMEAYTTPEGGRVRSIKYVADFSYYEKQGEEWKPVVEDVKSKATKTRVYAIKKKLLKEKYGIEEREVRKSAG